MSVKMTLSRDEVNRIAQERIRRLGTFMLDNAHYDKELSKEVDYPELDRLCMEVRAGLEAYERVRPKFDPPVKMPRDEEVEYLPEVRV